MRIREIINEVWDATLEVTNFRYKPIQLDVYRNPSKTEFFKLLAQHPRGLRGLIATPNDLLVWDAMATTHTEVEQHYNGTVGAWLLLDAKAVVLNDINSYYNDEYQGLETPERPVDADGAELPPPYAYRRGLRYAWEKTVQNLSLRRIYGDFTPVGMDNGEAEDREFYGVKGRRGRKQVMTPKWIELNAAPYV